MMTEIIQMIKTAAGVSVYPYDPQKSITSGIIYSFSVSSNDGAKKVYRLKLNIVTSTLTDADTIEDKITATIITVGDNSLTNTITQVRQNGGGDLYDYDRKLYNRILYFDIIMR